MLLEYGQQQSVVTRYLLLGLVFSIVACIIRCSRFSEYLVWNESNKTQWGMLLLENSQQQCWDMLQPQSFPMFQWHG